MHWTEFQKQLKTDIRSTEEEWNENISHNTINSTDRAAETIINLIQRAAEKHTLKDRTSVGLNP